MTTASEQALSVLRSPQNLQWYVIPLLIFVIYVYITEIQARNWSAVLLGIGMWAGELMGEMANALVLTATDRAALWTTPGDSAFVIYVGFNVEIAFMFAVSGVLIVKVLPEDRTLKILGVPNRIFVPAAFGLLAVLVESLLNHFGLLVWEYAWWSWPHVWLIYLVYTAPWLIVTWAHDHLTLRQKAITAGALSAAALCSHLVLATGLGWI